jgi:Chaperone of endosialidase
MKIRLCARIGTASIAPRAPSAKRLFVCLGFLACANTFASPLSLDNAASARPDALLQIDLNRQSVIYKIIENWKSEIPSAQLSSFRQKLNTLRADQLLAANISGSFDGVLDLVRRHEVSLTAAPNARTVFERENDSDRSKSAGDSVTDLVYTPISPCRLLDTRGIFSPVFAGGAYTPNQVRTYQMTGNCTVPAGAVAVVTQIIMITPSAAGDIELLPQGGTFGSTVAMVFQAGVYSSVSLVAKLNQSNGQFSTQIRGPGGDVAMDVTGYFMPPSRNGNGYRSFVDGGVNIVTINGSAANTATDFGGTIAGGGSSLGPNTAGGFASVGGGARNTASGGYSVIGGGNGNTASQFAGTVSGGEANFATAQYSTVAGGNSNFASGLYATAVGGLQNVAGGAYSFSAGRRAKGRYDGAFMWADSTDLDFKVLGTEFSGIGPGWPVATNTFNVRATGGVWFVTAVDAVTGRPTAGPYVSSGSGTWAVSSDRNSKTGLSAVNSQEILRKVVAMPISSWQYLSEKGVRHIGPMAQDFKRLFDVGTDDRSITTIDADGVALAAIQGLNQKLEAEKLKSKAKDAKINALERDLAAIKKKLGL